MAWNKFPSKCSVCGKGKTIKKTYRKMTICGDCPVPTQSQYDNFFYKHNSVTTLANVLDSQSIDNGNDLKSIIRRNERV